MYFLIDCEPLMPVIKLIRNGIIPIIQIAIPIALILLGMFDLGKAVVASKEDEIKAAQKLLVKRIIYAVAIFFVVTLVNAVFSIVVSSGSGAENTSDWKTCWNAAKNS